LILDIIKIKNMEVFARHGVFSEEKTLGQKFIISAELFMDIRKAGKSDDLSFSVDYGNAAYFIKNFVEENVFNLLETIAERLVEKLLIEFKELTRVRLEIKKPWAPVKIVSDGFSVIIEREWKKAFLSLGSNIGNKEGFLDFAIDELKKSDFCDIKNVSDFIVTKPVGEVEQEDFLNGCVEIKTLFTPYELLDFINRIEKKAGRKRTVHWGPRTLDIDIIFYDNAVIYDDKLKIPHIETENRFFVLAPLCQIAPFEIHPVYGKCVKELLYNLEKNSKTY